METNNTADRAMAFYDQLEDVALSDWNIRDKYVVLRDIFKRIINQGIAESNINFIGMFAKLDYLVKQHNIPTETAMLIHDTRKVLNHIYGTNDAELAKSLPYDIKASALLVEAINGGVTIPSALAKTFPSRDRKRQWSKFDINLMRCIVNSWDDDYIYATEEQNLTPVSYTHLTLPTKA